MRGVVVPVLLVCVVVTFGCVHAAVSSAILARVRGPTMPMGSNPSAVWNLATAACVRGPK